MWDEEDASCGNDVTLSPCADISGGSQCEVDPEQRLTCGASWTSYKAAQLVVGL